MTLASSQSGVNGTPNQGLGGAGSNGYVDIGSHVFTYTGGVQIFYPFDDTYSITVAGAQGGGSENASGGYGASSVGEASSAVMSFSKMS